MLKGHFFFFPTSFLNILVLNPAVPVTSNKDDLQQWVVGAEMEQFKGQQ